MKAALLSALALILIGLAESSATVLVYKGSATFFRADGLSASKQVQQAYFVAQFDGPNAGVNRLIFISSRNRTVRDIGTRFFAGTQVKTSPQPTTFLVANDRNIVSINNFFSNFVRLQGVNTSLTTLPNRNGVVTFPRTFTGLLSDIDGSPLVTTVTLVLTYDAVTTQTKNSANKTTLGVSQDIRSIFTGKGYTDTNPNVP